LFESPKSPFYKEFLESGLASNYCPGCGFSSDGKFNYFTIGFDNISKKDLKIIESKIFETLENISNIGFEKNLIESALHQIELNSKILGSNFGLM